MLADVDLEWEHPRHFFQAFIDRGGFMVCAPMREKTRLMRPRALFA